MGLGKSPLATKRLSVDALTPIVFVTAGSRRSLSIHRSWHTNQRFPARASARERGFSSFLRRTTDKQRVFAREGDGEQQIRLLRLRDLEVEVVGAELGARNVDRVRTLRSTMPVRSSTTTGR
jgi:hypothetical protein